VKQFTIKEIKDRLEQARLTEDELAELKTDDRKGVKRLIATYERKRQAIEKKRAHFKQLQTFDANYRTHLTSKIAGVDEAGRGPLAGPVVAAAVILPRRFQLIGLNDSKQLSEEERLTFYDYIKEHAESYYISVIDNYEIDQLNIYQATKKAMIESLAHLNKKPDLALIDAMDIHNFPYETHSIIKGDETSLSIAAASILAKVTRDQLMDEIDQAYPQYGFASNKGYGTKEHLEAIEAYGITPYHRRTFAPINKMK